MRLKNFRSGCVSHRGKSRYHGKGCIAMRDTNRRPTLKRTYYRSFLLMVVIPLVLVFVCAEVVVSYIIRSSAIETIDAFQENIATALSGDIRDNALQLSHFVYANDGEFIQTAVQVHQSDGSDWYEADQAMQRAFRTAMVPSQDILVGAFYMDRSGVVYMKDEVAVPEEQVRDTDWYRRAEERPNRVALGCYDTSRTRVVRTSQQDRQMVLVTAMATDAATDRTGQVEVAAFFTVSRAGDILASRQRNAGLGRSVILDRDGHVIFGDMGDDAVRDYFEDRLGRFAPGSLTRRAPLAAEGGERDYFFRTRAIPDTDWLVVTFVEESSLGQQFYQVGGILALIVTGLMTLFYFYSRYFLNAIIAPVQEVCHGMERLDQNDLEVRLEPKGQRELQDLMTSFNQMVLSIKHMLRLTEETLEKKHEAEIKALQSQINPHFIVNTLNSIRFMAQVAKFDGIRKMAEALVSIVSCSFRSNVSFYTVGEELEMLKTYVYLMRIRYSNSFEVSYHVQPGCLDYLLPRLTLQPVVENSITHGFEEMEEELGRVEVTVYQEEGFLCLSVWDNGRGMSREEIELVRRGRPRAKNDNTSIGLENVQARIRLNFGDAAGLTLESEPGQYTRATIRLPLAACTKKEEERRDSDPDCG